MKPTKQTVLHDPANGQHGNCLSAVIASLLHLPIEDVPLFVTPETWVKDLNKWLRPYGLAYCMVEDFDCCIDVYGIEGLWHEVSGNTSRSKDVIHACVARDGILAFDPHPDDTGLTRINCYGFFIALEPWRNAQAAKQEPECWYDGNKFYADEMSAVCDCADAANLRPLYAAPMPAQAPGVIDYCFIKEVSDKYGLDYNKFCAAYRAMLAAAPAHPNTTSDDAKDAARLDFLDENLRMRMGWSVGKAPAGNISIQSIIQPSGATPIREAIDVAIGALKGGE